MATHPKLVVVDATPLRARSGFRGIGRYIRDLLYGLEATRSDWQDELGILALDELHPSGRAHLDSDLARAADRAYAARGSENKRLKLARRVALARVAEREGAQLLHMPEALGTPLRCAVPRLVTCHDLIEHAFPREFIGGPIRRRLRLIRDQHRFRSADWVVAISKRTERDVTTVGGVRAERVRVILHGVDLAAFRADADPDDDAKLAALGLGERKYVVYAGDANWHKNVEGMARAVAVANRRFGVELAWAGALEPASLQRVRAIFGAEGVERQVRFLGFVPEGSMPALFRNAVAHLFLSRLEGFGLSVVEAMAVGCPVIVTRGSAADEVAAEAGIVVGADDAAAAGGAIVQMASDAAEREHRAALGRSRSKYFDRLRMARDYAALYRELASSDTIGARP